MKVLVMENVEKKLPEGRGAAVDRLMPMAARAYHLAFRVTGSPEAAEDAVQGAFLSAMRELPRGLSPEEERLWFFGVATNAARMQLRADRRRKNREAQAMREQLGQGMAAVAGPGPDDELVERPFDAAQGRELVERLRQAMQDLDEEHRLPVALCCEQGMTHAEAAAVLGVPRRTISRHVEEGLEQLRGALSRAGYSAAAAAVVGALAHTAPPVPATLIAGIEKVIAGGLITKSTGAAVASAAAKGGLTMKIVAGVIAAGALASGAVLLHGSSPLNHPPSAAVSSPPAANGPSPLPSPAGRGSEGEGKPAPVNEYRGMQEREEVFEFTQKPTVARQGDKVVVSFASKGKCDATVSIVAPDGKVVRHLASGVLGTNAPHPFQQDSLSQKLEWDGHDDAGKSAPAGCKVKVSLGLKPRFEMNIAYDPYALPTGTGDCHLPEFKSGDKYLVGRGAGGEIFVLGTPQATQGGYFGRVFGKDGKYVRTFWPPAAKDVEKLAQFKPSPSNSHPLAHRFATTIWGDKVLVCGDGGPTVFNGDGRKLPLPHLGKTMFFVAGVDDYKLELWPAAIPKPALGGSQGVYGGMCHRLAADRHREEIYAGFGNLLRLDGKTGKLDEAWTPRGELRSASEIHVGPDGLLYLRVGGANYGQWVIRMDHDGKVVPFTGNGAAPLPEKEWPDAKGKAFYCGDGWSKALKGQNVTALWTGQRSSSNVHTRGLYVSPRGVIVAQAFGIDKTWGIKHGIPADWPTSPSGLGAEWPTFGFKTLVFVWDKDGNAKTANAVGDVGNGHGVAMDRDGSIYAAIGGRWPAGQTGYDGIPAEKLSTSNWGSFGSLMKFQGGVPFPRGEASYGKETPAGFAKLTGYRSGPTGIKGALWIWGGLVCQTPDVCSCHNIRYDMDYFARHWIPSNQLYSVTVLDANGNRVARLGRYGNVDDTDEDIKAGKDGLRFVWPRAVAVSDTALYVTDTANRRILKAAIDYAAEETVPVS